MRNRMRSVMGGNGRQRRLASLFVVLALTASLLASALALVSADPAGAAVPTPTTYAATSLSNLGATLNAQVSPGGVSTTLTFCY